MCASTFGDDLSSLYKVMPYRGVKLWVTARVLRYLVRRQMAGHGIGRHSHDDVMAIGAADLRALSGYMGKPDAFWPQNAPVSVSKVKYHYDTHRHTHTTTSLYCEGSVYHVPCLRHDISVLQHYRSRNADITVAIYLMMFKATLCHKHRSIHQ